MIEPYFEQGGVKLYLGDCRKLFPAGLCGDLILTDPPYGDTSLSWDAQVDRWELFFEAPQLWCFGSMRFWLGAGATLLREGWKFAQDIVWEKHNGSSFHADRFKRVHEHALHFYRGEWSSLYRDVPTTPDARKRSVRRKEQPPHTGEISASSYSSEAGGPRIMRSVLQVRSCHGYAQHPTQKPTALLEHLIRSSCPPDGLVLDPFTGSGSTLIAARSLGRRAIGIEIEEKYAEIAAQRLSQDVMPFQEAL